LELALSGIFDIIILDIMLPGLNGMEVLRRIRRSSSVPVVMLTARDTIVDKVTGLDGGADDYMTKPFEIEELLARIRNALRKKNGSVQPKALSACGLILDVDKHEASVNGTPVELTKKEFDLLQYLLENKGIVLSRETLLEKVWGFDYAGETNAVDVYIRYLRGKIDEVYGIKLIHTVRGVGYVIKNE
jgi:DNA-binding response OmpR family regulator